MTEPAPDRTRPDAAPLDLPGMSESDVIDTAIRVDHAGEYGAVRIYQGQLAVLRHSRKTARSARLVASMKAGEDHHLETFERLMTARNVRPTLLQPFWHVAGFALGAATALMSEKAAMACTAAVETAIDAHYADQLRRLGQSAPDLAATIEQFKADEGQHKATALDEGAEQAPFYRLLSSAIQTGCRLAIKASERI